MTVQERKHSANEYADARDRITELEIEVGRLNKVILGWANEHAYMTTKHRHELAEYRAIITKLGHRLGCMRKRRKHELAERVMSTTYRCTHCGVRSQSEEALREHCRTCPKHPARAEVEELKAELADWRNSASQVMKEPCDANAVHCSCVPVLRHEVERLKNQAAHYSKAMWAIDREKNGYAEQVEQLQAMMPTKPEGADRLFWLMKPVLAKPFVLEED